MARAISLDMDAHEVVATEAGAFFSLASRSGSRIFWRVICVESLQELENVVGMPERIRSCRPMLYVHS